jgi:hypothetical protein
MKEASLAARWNIVEVITKRQNHISVFKNVLSEEMNL